MAVVSAFSVRGALPPRHTAAASAWRMPPRVYSPLTPRRLTQPMAVPATQSVRERRSGSRLTFLKR